MSRYFITGDMPNSCSECEYDGTSFGHWKCNKLKSLEYTPFSWLHKRHPQCPLQDTTELISHINLLHIRANRASTFAQVKENTIMVDKLLNVLGSEAE